MEDDEVPILEPLGAGRPATNAAPSTMPDAVQARVQDQHAAQPELTSTPAAAADALAKRAAVPVRSPRCCLRRSTISR
jgi:hypothetical protein